MLTNANLLTGMAVGLDSLSGLKFSPHKPFAACRLCGAVYQSERDRTEPWSDELRTYHDVWRGVHNRKHSEFEHKMLALSGRQLTPEAAYRLAPYGVIPMLDIVLDDEVKHAMATAPRAPQDDAEG